MLIPTSCPTCGNRLDAPGQLAGQRIRCLRCDTLFTVAGPGSGGAATATPPARRTESAADPVAGRAGTAVRAAFWVGVASLALGLAAGLSSPFRATGGYSQTLAWLGILLGVGAVVLTVVREECGFTFPFAGLVASLLSLALVAFWLGPAARQGAGRWGRWPGPAGGMDRGPPGWNGAPPGKRGRGVPPPPGPPG